MAHGERSVIRGVHSLEEFLYPRCGGAMKVIAFITDFGAVDRIIAHLGLTFVADKPPPSHVFEQVALAAAEESGEYF